MKARRWGRWVGKWVCVVLSVWIGVLWLTRGNWGVLRYEAFWWSGGTTTIDVRDGTLACEWIPRPSLSSPGGPICIQRTPRWPGWFVWGVLPTAVPIRYLWIPLWAPWVVTLAGSVLLWRKPSRGERGGAGGSAEG